MKVYKVVTRSVTFVCAEDSHRARQTAHAHLSDDEPEHQITTPLTPSTGVPKHWMDALPWDGDGETTIREHMERIPSTQDATER